ncbi:MAG: T9SS type A sorting domain-containing protein, partial [Candidatus Cloacimonetes bacterium]|nr:T9SS type A sorting domain-containing protein [Candidatus Cloacimonadota bacterium]
NTYHLSFGWNGVGDGWYSLPDGLPFGFNIIDAAIINIDSQSQGVNNTSHQDVILQNYPNPFSTYTTISFNLATRLRSASPGQAEIRIYNIKGQLVKTLTPMTNDQCPMTNDQCPMTSVIWDGKDERGKIVSSGIYFYQFKLGDKVIDTKKCLLLK